LSKISVVSQIVLEWEITLDLNVSVCGCPMGRHFGFGWRTVPTVCTFWGSRCLNLL